MRSARVAPGSGSRKTRLGWLGLLALTLASAATAPLASAATAPTAARAELVAERITAENVARARVGGPDADAGVGDWALSNGTICAAVSDPSHESPLTPAGGVLIDLGHCGREDDQFVLLQPMLNLSQSALVQVSEIEAGRGPSSAWLRTRAEFEGVALEITYSVHSDRPESLDVGLRARRERTGDRLFSIGLTLLHPSGQTPIFSLLRSAPERSVGFAHPASDHRSLLSLLNALVASDLTVLVGSDGMPPISYGLERLTSRVLEDGTSAQLASFSVTGSHFTFMNAMTRPLWFGAPDEPPGLFQLGQLPFMDVSGETILESDFRIHVGARDDIASITDRVFSDAPLVTGRIDDPDARIHVDRASGAPFTQVRPEADGRYRLRLPPGGYRLRALAAGDRSTRLDVSIGKDPSTHVLPDLAIGAPAWVRLPRGFVGRLVFLEEGGSAVTFGSDRLGLRIGEKRIPSHTEAPFLNLAASPLDPERVPLPPGRYRVIAVRGPEYASREVEIEARAGDEVALELDPLERVAETPGWIAADFHVHTGASFDSGLPPSLQAIAFAASGAELLVATEHDRVADPAPLIARAGLADRLRSMTGVEITSSFSGGDAPYSSGHLNAYPVRPDPTAYRGGAPVFEGRRLRDALASIQRPESKPFVQLNHPRPKPTKGEGDTFFSHLGIVGESFDPKRPLADAPNAVLIDPSPEHGGRDLDFEGIELMNGKDPVYYRRVRADWLSLLLQGERLVATANSDSHRLGVIVGLPRTYVSQEVAQEAEQEIVREVDPQFASASRQEREPAETRADLTGYDEASLMKALRSGRAWGTTGPLLSVRLDQAGLGGLHAGGTGTLHVAVDAAPWVPVAEWRAYVNGELVHRDAIAAGGKARLPLVFPSDAFVTVEVEGPSAGRYAEVLPGFTPLAFTNPIFVDADGNGRFDAPGLPDPLPPTLTDPDRPD